MYFQERVKGRSIKKFPGDTPGHRNNIQGRSSTEDQKVTADIMGQDRCMMCPHASSCLWFFYSLQMDFGKEKIIVYGERK